MNIKIIKTILVIIMIVSLINIFIWLFENNQTKKIVTHAKKYINIGNKNTLNPEIKTINEDIIGWLTVDNTKIDYPIVQTNNNEYYLNHNLDREYSSAGWIFMDSKNKLDDQNLIIYGHHRRDGSMFGSIDSLINKNDAGQIKLIIENNTFYYNIFSIYKTDEEYNYREKEYNNFNKKIQEFKKRSINNYNVNITNKKQIITLSTCDNDNKNRIVVHGIKINKSIN